MEVRSPYSSAQNPPVAPRSLRVNDNVLMVACRASYCQASSCLSDFLFLLASSHSRHSCTPRYPLKMPGLSGLDTHALRIPSRIVSPILHGSLTHHLQIDPTFSAAPSSTGRPLKTEVPPLRLKYSRPEETADLLGPLALTSSRLPGMSLPSS